MARKQTRNAQGGGSIRQRPDGRWEARYTAGRDPGTGKQIQKSVYGKSQKEVREKLQKVCAELDEGTYLEPSRMTVAQWLEIWEKEYLVNVKPHTRRSYGNQIKNHIKPGLGATRLDKLNAHTIQGFYNRLSENDGDKPGLAPSTIKVTHGVLRQALQQAVTNGYLRFNPADACKLPRGEKHEIRPMEEPEIAAFLKAIQGHQFEALYTVDLFTGLRQGEILGLMWDCVDFKQGTILVNKQLLCENRKGGGYPFASLKNGKMRTIAPAAWVITVLRRHRAEQAEKRLRASTLWKDTGLVFTNDLGEHLNHVTVYKNFKRIVKTIGIPETRFHDLRHSYATAAIQAGDDIKTVQGNLGHATAAFTLDVYGHVTEQMKQKSADRMEGFIKDVLNL